MLRWDGHFKQLVDREELLKIIFVLNPIPGGLQVARFRAGGFRSSTLLTRPPDIVAKKEKKTFDSSFETIWVIFSKVKIEANKSHQRSNFPKIL